MKTIAMMQPCYLPWPGHFHLWLHADEIVWVDDFQYSRGSFHSRNRVASENEPGWQWITVPIESHLGDSLLAAVPTQTSPWRRKHVGTLERQYGKAPHWGDLDGILDWIKNGQFASLAELNLCLLSLVGKRIGIDVPCVRSSELNLSATGRSDRIREILTVRKATRYLSARGSVPYMVEDGGWESCGVEISVQNFQCPSYRQAGSRTFTGFLSIVDALVNLGGKGVLEMLRSRSSDWMSFDQARALVAPLRLTS